MMDGALGVNTDAVNRMGTESDPKVISMNFSIGAANEGLRIRPNKLNRKT